MSNFIFWIVAGVAVVAVIDYRRFWYSTQFWIKDRGKRRPYTFIIRDISYQYPLFFGAFLFSLGTLAQLSVRDVSIFASGLLCGHLWWGSQYVPNQQECPHYDPDADQE